MIFGENLTKFGPPLVSVRGKPCTKPVLTNSRITCTLLSGAGKADILVTAGTVTDLLKGSYHYTNVEPGVSAPLTVLLPTNPPPPPMVPPPTPLAPTPLPPTPLPPTLSGIQFGISGFTFVDATTDNDIAPVPCNNCIGPDTIVNICANVFGQGLIGSMHFTVSKPPGASSATPTSCIENVSPFTLWGNNYGNYTGYKLTSGTW